MCYWKKQFIAFIFFVVCLAGCSKSFEGYTHNLPEDESINASLLNYEYLVEKIKNNVEGEDFFLALSNGLTFFEVFEEEDDQGHVNFYLHQALTSLMQVEARLAELQPFASNLTRQQRSLFHLVKQDELYVYANGFLQQQLDKRVGYALEMKAAEGLYLDTLAPEGGGVKEKLKVLEFFYRRFPNSKKAFDYLQSGKHTNWIHRTNFSKKKYFQLRSWVNHIEMYQWSEVPTNFSYLQGYFITLRNKTNYLFSRNLYSFDSWEEVEVLETKSNCLNSGWVNIRFGPFSGFVAAKHLLSVEIPYKEKIYFRQAQEEYLQKNFIAAAELAAKCIRKATSGAIKERGILLLEHCHREIAKRATSKTSPFLRYVLKYPKYFEVSEEGLSLKTSLFLFDFLREINNNSVLLACFFKTEDA